jgi:malate dehydrogenase
VRAFSGAAQLADALSGCDVVIIPAGVPRKPGMTVRCPLMRARRCAMLTPDTRPHQRDDLFNINAGIVKDVCKVR